MYATNDSLSTNKLENLAAHRWRKAADRLEAAIENLGRVVVREAPPSRPSATTLPFRLRRGEPVALGMAGPFKLERLSDISLADVVARNRADKHRMSIKDKPERLWTDAERLAWRETVRRQRHRFKRRYEQWREESPIGCQLDGLEYNATWRVGRLYVPAGERPSMTPTVKLFMEGWPQCRRIVCYSGNAPIVSYVKRAGAWEAIRPGHPDYIH